MVKPEEEAKPAYMERGHRSAKITRIFTLSLPMKYVIKRVIGKIRKLLGIENVLLLLGKVLADRNRNVQSVASLHEVEFRVYSQWGEDGIIQFLINKIKIPHTCFVEFGAGDYTESNTRFLLMNNNWSGLVIDASQRNIAHIKKDDVYWKHDLSAICSFVTKDNINQLLKDNLKEADIGLLSIDIDGNDYWIWKEINVIRSRIVICEYNSVFGYENFITVPYEADFKITKKHYSHLYWGASLPALCALAQEKGYMLIGCNSNGNNAFFVRSDISPFKPCDYKNGFVESKFREARDINGRLMYTRGEERINLLLEMKVFDVKSKKLVILKELLRKV